MSREGLKNIKMERDQTRKKKSMDIGWSDRKKNQKGAAFLFFCKKGEDKYTKKKILQKFKQGVKTR